MPRYVDIQILKSFHPKGILQEDWNAFVNDMPTIEERKKGKWIEPTEDTDYWECSVCHDTLVLEVDVTPQDARIFFCPNCGSYNGGDKNEQHK